MQAELKGRYCASRVLRAGFRIHVAGQSQCFSVIASIPTWTLGWGKAVNQIAPSTGQSHEELQPIRIQTSRHAMSLVNQGT